MIEPSVERPRAPLVSERASGDRIGGKLRLIRQLGEGAMGDVWLARHESLKHDVAVKFLRTVSRDEEPSREHLERFRFEGQVAARLSGHSPHIVSVHDVGATDDGAPYMVMEYVRGQTLEDVIDARNALPLEEVARIVEHVSLALEEAHARGVVHRDLKPSNLMVVGDLSNDGRVRVSDFGVAKLLARDHELDAPQPTREGVLVGSPAYMSPEQLTAETEPGPEADRWALAVVAYEALTGWMPFSGQTLSDLTVSVCQSEHDPPSALDETLPSGIDGWFAKAFSKDVESRFTDVVEMRDAFRAATLKAEVTPARRVTSKWFLLAALAAALLTSGIFYEAWRRAEPQGGSQSDLAPPDALELRTDDSKLVPTEPIADPPEVRAPGVTVSELPSGAPSTSANSGPVPKVPLAPKADKGTTGDVAVPNVTTKPPEKAPTKGTLDPSEIQ